MGLVSSIDFAAKFIVFPVNSAIAKMSAVLPFRAEYSPVLIFCCICRKAIKKDELKFGVMLQDITKDCLQPKWCHKSCFFSIRRPLSISAIDGLANLRYDDQMEIINILDQSDVLDPAVELQIEQQNAEFFTVYEKLKTLKNDDCVTLLTAKNQFVPDTKTEILTHLTDMICFGGFPLCPTCKFGQLVFRNTGYVCMGYDSPWSKCLYTIKAPKRVPVTLPPQHHELLGSNIKPRTRIVRNIVAFNDEDFELLAKQPLFGMEFLFIGETKKPKDVLEDKIRKMGGTIGTKVHKRLTAVISNELEANKMGTTTREAAIHRIQVIPEDFIDEVLDNDAIEVIIKKDMTKWGKDPNERLEGRVKDNTLENPPNHQAPNVDSWKWKCGDYDGDANAENLHKKGQIYENDSLRYSVMLNFVDISTNKNSYCKLQLVTYSGAGIKGQIIQCEGRIGTTIGITSSKDFMDLVTACNEFEKVFLEKTGNHFTASTENFVKQPGKYYRVDIDNDILSRKMPKISVPSKLSEPLFQLMKLLFIEKVMKFTLLEYCINLDSLPLGLIRKRSIYDAIATLEKIPLMLRKRSPNQSEIIRISNEVYSYFPHMFRVKRVYALNTNELVDAKLKMLRYMLEKVNKYDRLTNGLYQERNLLDVCHEQLEESAEIKMLNKSSKMYTEIEKYVHNTQLYQEQCPALEYDPGKFEVDEVFEVTRHEEVLRYAKHENNFNRQLLFHGSAIGNFVNILTNGLLITPLNARFHGSAFGKGVYFTDASSKSVRYCYADKGVGLMLLCEVALGYPDLRYNFDNSKLTDHCESVQAIGQYFPEMPDKNRSDGLKIPNGNLVKRTERGIGIIFNEFIVFDESRVKIRYLVKIKK